MTTTSIFQGVADGARISSRVNHPPGGATKLYSEAKREPKTVRVLKPPGGESSISFTDDDVTKHPLKNVSRASSRQASSIHPFTAAAEAEASSIESETADLTKDDDVKDAPVAKETRQSDSNGTPLEEVPQSPVFSASNFSLETSPVGVDSESSAAVPCNTENDSPALTSDDGENIIESLEISDERSSDTCINESIATVESSQTTTSVSETETGIEITAEERSTVSSNDSISDAPKENGASFQNGPTRKKEISPSPLSLQHHQTPSDNSSASPSILSSPSVKPNEDTKDRVIGQPATTPQNPQPRKIKDHMRSNIFMSDEDYTPTRSSRMNASVTTDVSPNVPAAGQRQRIPPGGFSTKLW